jgi:hypothetical protein
MVTPSMSLRKNMKLGQKLVTPYDYSIYHDFIESYLPSGFLNIDDNDPIMQKLHFLMDENDQMLIVMDLTKAEIIFTSKQASKMLGVDPDNNNPLEMMSRTHPDDVERFGMGRSKLMSLDKDLILEHKGSAILSTNLRMLKPDKTYANHLYQFYLFYSPVPHKGVYSVQINTDISDFKMKKDSFHYYVGKDISLFKFPDKALLYIGHPFTCREFEIIKQIKNGKISSEIAESLFISLHTVNTHRRNILEKSQKNHISDVIFDLMNQGLL